MKFVLILAHIASLLLILQLPMKKRMLRDVCRDKFPTQICPVWLRYASQPKFVQKAKWHVKKQIYMFLCKILLQCMVALFTMQSNYHHYWLSITLIDTISDHKNPASQRTFFIMFYCVDIYIDNRSMSEVHHVMLYLMIVLKLTVYNYMIYNVYQ